jgi:hypothetical protein
LKPVVGLAGAGRDWIEEGNCLTAMARKEEHKSHKADGNQGLKSLKIFVAFVFFFVFLRSNK